MIDVSFAAADRLRAQLASQFAFIGSVADFAALGDVPRTVPAAYVIPLDEQAEPNNLIGLNGQTHTATIGVVLIVRYAGDASGAKATMALGALRQDVMDTLVGWAPTALDDTVQFSSGTLVELMDGGAVAWRDDFTLRRRYVR
jgi:hypothetical protein